MHHRLYSYLEKLKINLIQFSLGFRDKCSITSLVDSLLIIMNLAVVYL